MSSTDTPLLHPAFIRHVLDGVSADVDIVLPKINGFSQPLSAAYRTRLLPVVEALVAADKLKPAFLFERCRVRRLDGAAMLRDATLAVRRLGALAITGALRTQRAAAWTLGQLADAIALVLDEHVVAVLNGGQTTRDWELPLAAGDTVSFMVAGGWPRDAWSQAGRHGAQAGSVPTGSRGTAFYACGPTGRVSGLER